MSRNRTQRLLPLTALPPTAREIASDNPKGKAHAGCPQGNSTLLGIALTITALALLPSSSVPSAFAGISGFGLHFPRSDPLLQKGFLLEGAGGLPR